MFMVEIRIVHVPHRPQTHERLAGPRPSTLLVRVCGGFKPFVFTRQQLRRRGFEIGQGLEVELIG
jgi:hypothetical protein